MPDTLHQGQPILTAGTPLDKASATMIMIHGRGASAHDILQLSREFDAEGFAYLAPQAANNTWYPNRFLVSTQLNEPWLSSALTVVDGLVSHVVAAGLSGQKLILLGFSQGGCLTLEYAARHGQRYGGLVGLSCGLIGAEGEPRHDSGSLAGTPTFMGCSDVDFHVPKERVEESAKILSGLGADVTARLYPNLGHEVNRDEIEFIKKMMGQVIA